MTLGVAFVTGATSGVGRQIARDLAARHRSVLVGYHTDERGAQSLAQAICESGGRAVAVPIDVRNRESIAAASRESERLFGLVDVLVNVAAFVVEETFAEITPSSWDDVADVSLRGTFFCCQEFGQRMVARGTGAIVNVTSTAALKPLPRAHHYVAAKSGLTGLTKAVALSVAPTVIVNAVAPGYIESQTHTNSNAEFRTEIAPRIPLGRPASLEDVSRVVIFLALDNRYITGQTIVVDGGLTLT